MVMSIKANSPDGWCVRVKAVEGSEGGGIASATTDISGCGDGASAIGFSGDASRLFSVVCGPVSRAGELYTTTSSSSSMTLGSALLLACVTIAVRTGPCLGDSDCGVAASEDPRLLFPSSTRRGGFAVA